MRNPQASSLQARAAGAARLCGSLLALLFAALSLPGCAATRIETGVHPNPAGFEEIPVLMDGLKSVQTRAGQDAGLAVAVAISGGGHRAANFGVGVLLGLESLRIPGAGGRNALQEVDYLSTVSGGGFAGAAYIASLRDWLRSGGDPAAYSLREVLNADSSGSDCEAEPPFDRQGRFDPCMRRHLQQSYHKSIASFLNPFDLNSWRVIFTDLDRTNLLEDAIDRRLLGTQWRCQGAEDGCEKPERFSLRLEDLFVRSGSGDPVRLPYWIANATTFEDGNIFPFTPAHLMRYRVRSYTHALSTRQLPGQTVPGPAYEQWVYDIPVALAVTASGNFPGALPATTLRADADATNTYLHLLDGGLADNLGVTTAVRLLRQDGAVPPARKVLIVVDAYRDTLGPYSVEESAPTAAEALERTTSAGLDAWRARYREVTRAFARASGVEHVIFITFADLNHGGELERLRAMDYRGLERTQLTDDELATLVARLREREAETGRPDAGLDRPPLTLPFKLLRNVATAFDLSVEEQKLLLSAGRRIVAKKAAEIRAALGGGG